LINEQALIAKVMTVGQLTEEDAQRLVAELSGSNRVHKELY